MIAVAPAVLTIGNKNTKFASPTARPYAAAVQHETNPRATAHIAAVLSR